MKKYFSIFCLMSILLLMSCEKQEGVGGSSSIKGMLYIESYNSDYSQLIEKAPAQDKKVYIQYGDAKEVSDEIETSQDGYFEFQYLNEGEYTIYYYSEDSSDVQGQDTAIEILVVLASDEEKDLGNLNIVKSLDFDEGKATITGTVYLIDGTQTVIEPGSWVYLRPQNGQEAERVRSLNDGTFYFNGILPGTYVVYVLSEVVKGSEQMVPVEETVVVTENDYDTYNVGNIEIYRF